MSIAAAVELGTVMVIVYAGPEPVIVAVPPVAFCSAEIMALACAGVKEGLKVTTLEIDAFPSVVTGVVPPSAAIPLLMTFTRMLRVD